MADHFWYYVVGTERMGPIEEGILEGLFRQENINKDTYIWRKGFEGWVRLREVEELSRFFSPVETKIAVDQKEPTAEISIAKFINVEELVKDTSKFPEKISTANFKEGDLNDEPRFFLRIGFDRREVGESQLLYGPYTYVEVKAAIEHRRVNQHTLCFKAGFSHYKFLFEVADFSDAFTNHALNESLSTEVIKTLEAPTVVGLLINGKFIFQQLLKNRSENDVVLASGNENLEHQTYEAAFYLGDTCQQSGFQIQFSEHAKWWQAYRGIIL